MEVCLYGVCFVLSYVCIMWYNEEHMVIEWVINV